MTAVPLGRLVGVELRKLVDARSGRWLLVAIALGTAAAVVGTVSTAEPASLTFRRLLGVTATPQSLLLPVLAILTVTTEWTQRTGLITFVLEPKRGRVASAKLAAVVLAGLVAVLVALTAAAAGNLAGMVLVDGAGSWDLALRDVRDLTVVQLLAVLQGFALAMLLTSTPAALVAHYAAPLMWGAALASVAGLRDAAPWLDLNRALAPLYAGGTSTGEDWARITAAAALWVLLPLAWGTVRLLRRDIDPA